MRKVDFSFNNYIISNLNSQNQNETHCLKPKKSEVDVIAHLKSQFSKNQKIPISALNTIVHLKYPFSNEVHWLKMKKIRR